MPAWIGDLLWSGWSSLADYLAAHVLLCLVPAFIIAGYLSGVVPKEVITRFLGPKAPKWISYPASALGGFILAVCSCTILPLFAGIWRRGAGLGPAVTFLFVGPAINILAITYTAVTIGADIAIARLVLSILFGILIGLIMAWVFRRDEAQRAAAAETSGLFSSAAAIQPAIWVTLALLFGILLAGTLQIPWLTEGWIQLPKFVTLPAAVKAFLSTANLTPQGALLILLLAGIAILAWKGFQDVFAGFNRWTWAALLLIALTILVAAPVVDPQSGQITLNGRFFVILGFLIALAWVSAKYFSPDERNAWIWETWKFSKQIFPPLLVGVFAAGIIKAILPAEWVQSVAGQNTLPANFVGVLFGVFMYFPTLVEVPVAKMFLDLGMARGPLLAYLLADPELSLQSILVLNRIMGKKKTLVYVLLVAIMAAAAGYLFGIWNGGA